MEKMLIINNNNKYLYLLLLFIMPLKTPFKLEIVNDLNDQ